MQRKSGEFRGILKGLIHLKILVLKREGECSIIKDSVLFDEILNFFPKNKGDIL
jgi:hypothetical protein